jgi:Ulp1 family protease
MKWTKKIDAFEKEILVIPVNAFSHWFCLLVLKPKNLTSDKGSKTGAKTEAKAEIIYCDSMLEKRDFIV